VHAPRHRLALRPRPWLRPSPTPPLPPSSTPSENEWWKKQPGDDDWTEDRWGALSTSQGAGQQQAERGGGRQRQQQQGEARGSARQREEGPQERRRGGSNGGRRDGEGRRGGGGGGGGRGRAAQPWERGVDEEEDTRGWWQIPREEREAELAGSQEPLEAWQEARLVAAFAYGRRRLSVQQLAAELGLDRWGRRAGGGACWDSRGALQQKGRGRRFSRGVAFPTYSPKP
jgi:hypothetical protein